MPRSIWAGWGASALVIIFTYHSAIWRLVGTEWFRTDFDYCFLVPFIMAYLLWERRYELVTMPSQASWHGLWAFVAAVFMLVLGELGGEFLSLYLSMWFAVLGVCWSILGRRKLGVTFFPLLLLLTAFPPPNYLYSRMTLSMQLISTWVGAEFLHALGIPAFREGNVIDMGFTQLEIVAACSGLRFLIPLMIVGLVLTYYFRTAWWRRVLLMAMTLPLAIVMNGLRIGISGVLARRFGSAVLEGPAHDIMGWTMFAISSLCLFGWMRLLKPTGERLLAPFPSPGSGPTKSRPLLAPALTGLFLLVAASGYLHYLSMTPNRPTAGDLSAFPTRFEGWEGRRLALEQRVVDELDFTDYVQIDYRNPQGRTLDFYVAWYESQSKGESIHSPETCLRGGGWHFVRSGAAEMEISGFGPVRLNRAFLEQGGQRMLCYFWFPARGRRLVNGLELKIYTMWDSLTLHRTDGALVRLITPLYSGEDEGDGEERLNSFLKHALPVLESVLPGRDLSGHVLAEADGASRP
jgi:exosortase D (VPLPA-CTERM-specific)